MEEEYAIKHAIVQSTRGVVAERVPVLYYELLCRGIEKWTIVCRIPTKTYTKKHLGGSEKNCSSKRFRGAREKK